MGKHNTMRMDVPACRGRGNGTGRAWGRGAITDWMISQAVTVKCMLKSTRIRMPCRLVLTTLCMRVYA